MESDVFPGDPSWVTEDQSTSKQVRKSPWPIAYHVSTYFSDFMFISSKHGGFVELKKIRRHNKL
jgi:hypothetical protein